MYRKLSLAIAMLLAADSLCLSASAPDIGKAIAVKNEVSLESGQEKSALLQGAVVHQDEIIVTGHSASAEVELLDKTKLAVGPDARIVLDKFVYDPKAAPSSISITLAKGAFRFITGAAPKTAYEIKTPTTSLGIRGTVFDVYVGDNGETAVLLHEGGVDICNTVHACRRLDKLGAIIHVGLSGVFTAPLKWDGTVMKGIAVAKAFPFVGKQLVIDPVRRLSPDALIRGTGTIGRTITEPARQIQRVLPLPGLPF